MSKMTNTKPDSEKMSASEVYGKTLSELGEKHPEIVGLSADLAGSTKIGLFGSQFPDRFFNAGIAEQNMFGMAAGLASAGLVPFVSTFAVFASMRALEQLHSDICYPNLNVKIIATHAGLSFGQAGSTHHCTEDLAIMRSLANLAVMAPADGIETAHAVRAAYERKGPVYIRINRGFDHTVYDRPDYGFEFGKAQMMRDGSDLSIICCGSTVWRAVEAAKMLEESDGLKIRVLNMHTIKPIDKEAIKKAVKETGRIITAEDHNIFGGLGSAVAEVAAETGRPFAFKRLGVPDTYSIIGKHEDLMAHYGYDENGIMAAAKEMMGRKPYTY
mgnify:CR=1 FL=1